MGFSVEYSGVVISHLVNWAVLILAVMRCALGRLIFSSSVDDDEQSTASPSISSAQMIRDSLHVTTYRDIAESRNSCNTTSTCAICLNELRSRDKVRDLINCCHVFHKRCIDRWIDHKTCPLCRAPLLPFSSSSSSSSCSSSLSLGLGTRSDPSWPVDRLLYLFGDDLLL